MTTKTDHPHIVIDKTLSEPEPVIAGTKTRVRSIVEQWRLGCHPEELTLHYPHLSLAQIFDALSYYMEHQNEIHEFIKKNRIPDTLIHPSVKNLK
jgi:uncharacterized protein (DUF433 family)